MTTMFSTKAEYGVRVMIELGRRHGATPVSLTEIAETERLPLAYLEHLTARLRRADLIDSTRGARGGYRLAKRPEDVRMSEVVEALEGGIAPMACLSQDPPEKVSCSHSVDHDKGCATKLMWSRVQNAVVASLESTTLAELVAFAESKRSAVLDPVP